MDTSLFGVLWSMLHCYAFYLPDTTLTKELSFAFAKFVEYLVTLIPCKGCVYHASRYFIENKYTLYECTTGPQFFAWTVTFHNEVNARLGRRKFTVMEAESALLMQLTGRSSEQQLIEDENTNAKRKIKKLQAKLLMLQNKSHLIEQASTDSRLTQMFAHHKKFPDGNLDFDHCVFRAFFLIALEYHFDKPLASHDARNAQELLRLAFELFPHNHIASLSTAFYEEHKPNFVQAHDIFNYTMQWFNAVAPTAIPKATMIENLRSWANCIYKRQAEIRRNKQKDESTIRALRTEYNAFFQKKRDLDADRMKTQPKTQRISQTAVVLSCALLIITILLAVFVGLYTSGRKSKKQKSVL